MNDILYILGGVGWAVGMGDKIPGGWTALFSYAFWPYSVMWWLAQVVKAVV